MTPKVTPLVAACIAVIVAALDPGMARAGDPPRTDPGTDPGGIAAPGPLQKFAREMLESDAARYLSTTGRNALELIAGRSRLGEIARRGGRQVPASQDEILHPTNVRVNDPNQDPDAGFDITTQSETATAAFGSTVLVAFNDSGQWYNGSYVGYGRSTDGGASFIDMGTVPTLLPNAYNLGDPALVADRHGNFYTAYIGLNENLYDPLRIGIQKSSDGGASWGLPVFAPPFESGSFTDKELMAVDNSGSAFSGNLYVSWTNFGFSIDLPIVLSRSTDGGASFQPPIQISTPGSINQGSEPAVGPRGEVYVAWEQLLDRTYVHPGSGVVVAKSIDGGATFGTPVFVAPLVDIGFGTGIFFGGGSLMGNFRTNSFRAST